MFKYDEAAYKAIEVLDRYDLTDLLSDCLNSGCRDIWDVKEKVAARLPEVEPVIDDLTSDELTEYLCIRYDVIFAEEITYRMYGTPKRIEEVI